MKKFLGFIALALFVCLPLTANAAISVENGMSCTKPAKDSEGRNFVTCTLTATTTENESLTSFAFDLAFNEPSNIELDEASVKGSGAFEAVVAGNTISFNAATAQTGEKIELGKFTYYIKDLAKSCSFTFTPTGAEKIDVEVENPKTGSAVSYVTIAAGVLLVAGAFVLSRKNTKMYKI